MVKNNLEHLTLPKKLCSLNTCENHKYFSVFDCGFKEIAIKIAPSCKVVNLMDF